MIIIYNFGGMESDYNIKLMKAWKEIIIYNFGGMERYHNVQLWRHGK